MEEKIIIQRGRRSLRLGGHPGALPLRDRGHVQRPVRQGARLPVHLRRSGDAPGPRPRQPFFGLSWPDSIFYQIIESVQTASAINGPPPARPRPGREAGRCRGRHAQPGRSSGAIVLVALGGLLLLANFDVIDYDTLFDFWPLAVIVLGLKLVFDPVARSKKGK